MHIKKVILRTRNIESMKQFYTKTLGMTLNEESENRFQVLAGASLLEFTSHNVKGNPYYHFALDIPSNKFSEAKAWAKSKVKLNLEDGEDEADFSHLSAHSIYFYDPAGNIVEFICRHSYAEKSEVPFSANSILNISEMSLTVGNAVTTGHQLMELGLNERDGDPISGSSLNFMGENSNGPFLLLIQPGRRWIFSDKQSEIHPIEMTLDTNERLIVNDHHEFLIAKSR
ncbi:VOC family protein [Piscibacillus salipiscarius]|uniref:VOC family protein n=1 Tax=Piscibacillus salipiscarius TaxID=299480 RepID=A0ABW5Q7G3_9BACI|nr:VOC family protein [Piscibacillus salipiscarius]